MKKKILLVEDEDAIIQLLSVVFGDQADYEIIVAQDGAKAVEMVRENHPDIVLLDIGLPELNGIEVCRTIKSDQALSDIKVIMISGMVQASDKLQASQVGADAFIQKPFSIDTLTEEVGKLLYPD